jgi:endonuclease III
VDRQTYDLALLRNGRHDPTTRILLAPVNRRSPAVDDNGTASARIERATLTPCGPGSIAIDITPDGECHARAWGPGADWLRDRVPRLTARVTEFRPIDPRHQALSRALRQVGQLHLPASDTPYHEVLPAVLGQRITAAEALRQWSLLCERYGEPAPGPLHLQLPPTPTRLQRVPSWEFHRLGIEQQRARSLLTAARHARYIDDTRQLDGAGARDALMRLPGIGVWTAAVTIGVSHGDPDALPVGDFHVKNTVAWALNGQARGSDDEMLRTLEPYAGQRWQVVRTLELAGLGAPRFGARRPILDVARL